MALGKDTIGELLHNLGRTCTRITKFMLGRVAKIPSNHLVAIDGMLKSYESDDSFLSDFSHKALKSGIRDVSVMMAYDVETMEPVCASVYPGNLTDRTVFRDFVETNHEQGGIIITDRGF